jgi:hypothetical protein
MFQDIMDELQFFPLVFNFHICGFDIYGTLVARINRKCRGLPVLGGIPCTYSRGSLAAKMACCGEETVMKFKYKYFCRWCVRAHHHHVIFIIIIIIMDSGYCLLSFFKHDV